MNVFTFTPFTRTRPQGNRMPLNQPVGQAKPLLRQMQETVEDIANAHIIERATRREFGRPPD